MASTGMALYAGSTISAPADGASRIGIVYSDGSVAKFFDKMAYSQLFMAAQNQAVMADVSYDLPTEGDLLDASRIAASLLFPAFAHVRRADAGAIASALAEAQQRYHVALIASGEYMVYGETGKALPGDPYARMKCLLGLDISGGGWPADVTVRVTDTANPMLDDYVLDEIVHEYRGVGWLAFSPLAPLSSDVEFDYSFVEFEGKSPGAGTITTASTTRAIRSPKTGRKALRISCSPLLEITRCRGLCALAGAERRYPGQYQ